jgi:hypothetical protein
MDAKGTNIEETGKLGAVDIWEKLVFSIFFNLITQTELLQV